VAPVWLVALGGRDLAAGRFASSFRLAASRRR